MDEQIRHINRSVIVKCLHISILFLLISLIVTGCISAHSNIRYGPTGPPIGGHILRQVKKHSTTRAWLISVLGQPSCESETSKGTRMLQYHYVKKIDSKFSIDPFLDMDEEKEEHTTLYFEVRNGIVTNFWKVKRPWGTVNFTAFDELRNTSN